MLLALSLLACAPDADWDGFSATDDCDDANALVYPGAPETPDDGVDNDCADGDAPLPWLGDWTITTLTAQYSGLFLFVAGTESGTLRLGSDATVSATVEADVNPDLAPITISLALEGESSRIENSDVFVVYAEALAYDEQMHIAWECAMADDATLECDGELKALEQSLDADVVLVR